MKYSIIIPTIDNVHYLSQAVASVLNHSKDFEILVIDNAGSDSTKEYVGGISKVNNNVSYIALDTNKGFGGAINVGLHRAKGDYLILFNDDALATPNWLTQMLAAMRRYEKKFKVRVGLAGPATNFAGGRQQAQGIQYNVQNVDKFAEEFHKSHINNVDESGFLSGFCLLFKRRVWEDVGDFDEIFFPGGYEDNDFLLRANEKGWYGMISGDTFVHHFGSKTISRKEFASSRGGLSNRLKFYEKWSARNKGEKKLVAMYRVKEPDDYFVKSLNRTSEFADSIVVLVDNPEPNDQTQKICEQFPKVAKVHVSKEPFNERRDRNYLVQMAEKEDADWIISIDDDEVFEDAFTHEKAQQLMHPANPHIKMYGFHWKTFFNGTTHFRTDGIFGNMQGYRMVKVEPNRRIMGGTEKGLHCGNLPSQPLESMRFTNLRVKHYGYCTPEKCAKKFEWYSTVDDEKIVGLIGQEDYSHLIQERMTVYPWKEKIDLSLLMTVSNGGDQFCEIMDYIGYFADEIVIGDAGSTDDTIKIAKFHGAKIYPIKFENHFSNIKNSMIEKCKTSWILLMDHDESFEQKDVPRIRIMIDTDWDGFMFQVLNHQRDGKVSFSEAVRLFKNIPCMRYTGRVHENFDDVMFANKVQIARSAFPLHHYGFTMDPKDLDVKLEFYKTLNEKQMKEYPRDPRAPFNLALHYLNEGNVFDGIRLLKRAIALNPNFYQPQKELGLTYVRLGQRWIEGALEALPPDHLMRELLQRLIGSITSVIGKQDIKVGTQKNA